MADGSVLMQRIVDVYRKRKTAPKRWNEKFNSWRHDQTWFRHGGYWIGLIGLVWVLGYIVGSLKTGTQSDKILDWKISALGIAALTTFLVSAPFFRFLASGWNARYDEFRNRLTDTMLIAYLKQYWEQRLIEKGLMECPQEQRFKAAGLLFLGIYREQYGRPAFRIPIVLLATIVFVETCWLVLANGGSAALFDKASIQVATASIAGAYLFAVGDSVLSVRRRSLNVADVYWYALRMLVAVPVGAAVAALTPGKNQPGAQIAALALGMLPIGEFIKTLRRLPYWAPGVPRGELDSDQLTKLEGVTIGISDLLRAEGVTSVEQLIGMDPVLLSIRTGLPFDLILNLSSQALVRRSFSDSADRLVDIGLADAEAIESLVRLLDGKDEDAKQRAKAIVDDATARLQTSTNPPSPRRESVEFCFRIIAASPYTTFFCSARENEEAG